MAVIRNDKERDSALKELERLWSFLQEVEGCNPDHGSTKAGIHKMMARIHEELMEYEARRELDAAAEHSQAQHAGHVGSPASTAVAPE